MLSITNKSPYLPSETMLEARKIYNIQHIYLRIGDQLEDIIANVDLALIDPSASLPGEMVLRLALATAFQYVERFPDPLAEQATLKRMDWKYALRLPIRHPGISAAALCNFRQSLFSFPTSAQQYKNVLTALGQAGLFSRSVKEAIDVYEVLTTICNLTWLYHLHLDLRSALSYLAVNSPEGLNDIALPHWFERYNKTDLDNTFVPMVSADLAQEENILAADAYWLLDTFSQLHAPNLGHLDEIQHLTDLLDQHFQRVDGIMVRRQPGGAACTCHF